jgi:hypothetical protein
MKIFIKIIFIINININNYYFKKIKININIKIFKVLNIIYLSDKIIFIHHHPHYLHHLYYHQNCNP